MHFHEIKCYVYNIFYCFFRAESNGGTPVAVRCQGSVQNGQITYSHKWSSLKVLIVKTGDMLPERIFHAESNGGNPVAVWGRESVQNGRQGWQEAPKRPLKRHIGHYLKDNTYPTPHLGF